jgi:hypothetical protein
MDFPSDFCFRLEVLFDWEFFISVLLRSYYIPLSLAVCFWTLVGWELQVGCACWFRGVGPLLKLSLLPWTLVVAVVDLTKPLQPVPGLCEGVVTLFFCGFRCVCEANGDLLSPGCQCDRVPLLLLPLFSGFLFVVPNCGYIYSLLSMFFGVFL